MFRLSRRFLCACLVVVGAAHTPAQTATIDATLIERLVAGTDAERDALIAQHAEVLTPSYRQALSQLALARRNDGDLTGAAQAFATSLHLARHHALPALEVPALLGLASVAAIRAEFRHALDLANEGLTVATTTGNQPGRVQALSNIAVITRRTGDLLGALASATESVALARSVGEPVALSRSLNNLGIVYEDMGLGARAIEAYTEALRLKEANNVPALDLSTTLSNMGEVYSMQGDYALAEDFYLRSLAKVEAAGIHEVVSNLYNNLAQMYLAKDDAEHGRPYLEKAIALNERIQDPTRLATSLYLMGTLDRAAKHWDDAERTQRRALAMREAAGDRLGVIESLTELSGVLAARERAAEAVPYADRAVALATESGLAHQLWRTQWTAGRLRQLLGRDDEARKYYDAAIQTLETLRREATSSARTQQHIMTERLGPYYALASLDIRAGRPFDALATVDKARARALTDLIASGHAMTSRFSAEERAADLRLTQDVRSASEALDLENAKRNTDSQTIAGLAARLASARNAREAFLESAYARQPVLRFARGNTSELTHEQLASALTPGVAIVSFVLDDPAAWAYVITADATGPKVTTHKLAMSSNDLQDLAGTFVSQVGTRDLSFAPTARRLYDALLGPADAALAKATSIVIVPDGPLWTVPFQALRTPRNRYLIEERAVSYTPSIAALTALEARRHERTAATPFLVALGDPALPAAMVGTAAPGTQAQRGIAPQRLPEAAREVRAIGQLYGASKSTVLTDAAATESSLRSLISRASVLHIATHGFLEDANPTYSHLQLSATDVATRDHVNDGRLEAWEVQDMTITADVAVLSACRSGGGGGFGEGVVGFTWSLFAAGASTAVVSQWEVDSASTTTLMIAFHQGLMARNAAATPPAALRQAQLSLLKNPQFRHPFYWAGFDVIGAR